MFLTSRLSDDSPGFFPWAGFGIYELPITRAVTAASGPEFPIIVVYRIPSP